MGRRITIEVIGPGCPFCRKLFERARRVVEERGVNADTLHVTDIRAVLRHFPFMPVLRVGGRIVHRGKRLPKKDRLWELIRPGIRLEEANPPTGSAPKEGRL